MCRLEGGVVFFFFSFENFYSWWESTEDLLIYFFPSCTLSVPHLKWWVIFDPWWVATSFSLRLMPRWSQIAWGLLPSPCPHHGLHALAFVSGLKPNAYLVPLRSSGGAIMPRKCAALHSALPTGAAMNSNLLYPPLGSKGRWLQVGWESQVSPFCGEFVLPDHCWCERRPTLNLWCIFALQVKFFRDDLFFSCSIICWTVLFICSLQNALKYLTFKPVRWCLMLQDLTDCLVPDLEEEFESWVSPPVNSDFILQTFPNVPAKFSFSKRSF